MKPYILPDTKVGVMKAEVKEMLKLKDIQPAVSPYSSPIVLVQKHDGMHRF